MGKSKQKMAILEVFIMTLMLFEPLLVSRVSRIDHLISLIMNTIYVLLSIVWVTKGMKTDKWMRLVIFFSGTIIVATAINSGNLNQTVIIWAKFFFNCLIIKTLAQKYNITTFHVIKHTLFFLVVANLITLIFMPEGVIQIRRVLNRWASYEVPWWLLGGKNGMFLWLFPANLLAQIDLLKNKAEHKSDIYDYIIIVSTLITGFLAHSSTTIMTIGFLSLFAFAYRLVFPLKKLLSMRYILVFYIVFTIILVTASQNVIFEMVSGWFGKDATFTGRTFAWENAIQMILEKLFLGYGTIDVDTAREVLGGYGYVNAHNTVLQTLLEGGIVLLFQFFFMFITLGKKINTLGEKYNKIKLLMNWSVLVLCIQMSFEAYTDSKLIWVILAIMYYVLDFIEEDGTTKI